jgi:glucosyl-dolichyl phosphate glucuronosyltransferase
MVDPARKDPLVSVIVCAHMTERYGDLTEALSSLKAQSYPSVEIVCVSDGNADLYDRLKRDDWEEGAVLIHNEINMGLSESRNRGIFRARGDIIAFFDDDAVADPRWIEELVKMYSERNAIAAGGRILPLWLNGKPGFLPPEYYWLIGATHKGFAEEVGDVRNTFGSNISFKTDVLKALGGFRSEMGFHGKGMLQSEETEFCDRMKKTFGKGVTYNPQAIVYHKVFPERLKKKFLFKRAFWQGYSKRVMVEMGSSLREEGHYLGTIGEGIVDRAKTFSLEMYCQAAYLLALTAAVGFGYLYRAVISPLKH